MGASAVFDGRAGRTSAIVRLSLRGVTDSGMIAMVSSDFVRAPWRRALPKDESRCSTHSHLEGSWSA